MTTSTAPAAVSATLHAVITRADGTVVDLGQISSWHRSPLQRLKRRIFSKAAWLRHSRTLFTW